jgi:predicted NBD/HSP70 family sugar kinase
MLKLKNIKAQNTLAVLNILRREDQISRAGLAARLNCDGTTVTRIVRELASKDLVLSGGLADSTGGRPREIIRLNADARHAIGIGLDPASITGVIVNLKGKIIVREQIFLGGAKTAESFTEALKLISSRLLAPRDGIRPLGLGVAAFGTFSGEDKTLGTVAGFPAIENLSLTEFFKVNYSAEPEITDSTIARLMNETWFNDTGNTGSFGLFTAGAGIGFAAAVDGKIVFSRHSHAGEFGHIICHPDGELCQCGRRGCLETLCSTGALEKKLRLSSKDSAPRFSEIVKRCLSGDSAAVKVVIEAAKWLGTAIANQVNSMPPDEIMITGELMALGDPFRRTMEETIDKYVFPVFRKNLKVTISGAGEDGAALGAASTAARKLFEPPLPR